MIPVNSLYGKAKAAETKWFAYSMRGSARPKCDRGRSPQHHGALVLGVTVQRKPSRKSPGTNDRQQDHRNPGNPTARWVGWWGLDVYIRDKL